MGRTSEDYIPTINPARRQFERGNFSEAAQLLMKLPSNKVTDAEVIMMTAVCVYRLGLDRDALNRLRASSTYSQLNDEQKLTVLWHEFVEMIAGMRFEPAIDLLRTHQPKGADTMCLRSCGEFIRYLRRASSDLNRANKLENMKQARDTSQRIDRTNTGLMKDFIGLMNDYLKLMLELMDSPSIDTKRSVQELSERISAADAALGRKLPVQRRLVNFHPKFKP